MYRILLVSSKLMAWCGGAVLLLLICLTCLSVAGRVLNSLLNAAVDAGVFVGVAQSLLAIGVGPIFGDVEITEAGIAFAIFAFLPLCHLLGAHASVDVFTSRLPDRMNRILGAVIGLVFAAVMALIAVQLFAGMQSKIRSGQTSFLIEFPVWWAYAASLIGAALSVAVAIFIAGMRVLEAVQGRAILPEPDA